MAFIFSPYWSAKSFYIRECLLYTQWMTAGHVVSPHPISAFVPAPPVAPVPSPAPMPPVHPPPPMEDEPVSKKLKSEDSLIPEEEFLRRNKVPVWAGCLLRSTGLLGWSASSAQRGCKASSLHRGELMCKSTLQGSDFLRWLLPTVNS